MKKNKAWIWGLYFILAGVFFLLVQMGYFMTVGFWPLMITLLLIPIFLMGIIQVNFGSILFPLAIIAIVFRTPLGIEAITPWPVLITALFLSIGLELIFRPKRCRNNRNQENFAKVVNCPDEEVVEANVNFSSSIKYINSENFKKANLTCHFGALKVYFDNTKMAEDTAEVHLDVSFGGVEILIPKDWNVINNCNVSLGGVDEKISRKKTDGPTLILTGNVSLSGVEIKYV